MADDDAPNHFEQQFQDAEELFYSDSDKCIAKAKKNLEFVYSSK